MATPILRVSVYSDGSHSITRPPASSVSGYRCLHMAEGGDPHALGNPAVHNSESIAGIDFNQSMQLLSYNINRRTNPNFTGQKWRSVYSDGVAFTNGNGFEKDGDPRADFVNRVNMDKDLPKLMRAIICSGSFFRGVIETTNKGRMLTLYPGEHGINVNQYIGYDEQFCRKVIDNHWYFYAVNADMHAASHFSQGVGMPVLIPLFLKVATQYPLAWFEPWNRDYLPNPTTFYRN